jgi:hypothetical protein
VGCLGSHLAIWQGNDTMQRRPFIAGLGWLLCPRAWAAGPATIGKAQDADAQRLGQIGYQCGVELVKLGRHGCRCAQGLLASLIDAAVQPE